jgi:hypothetical protein
MPLEYVLCLMCTVTDTSPSVKLGKELFSAVSETRDARVHVGGLKSFPLLPICRLKGDWSHVTAAIALPGRSDEILVCRSSLTFASSM